MSEHQQSQLSALHQLRQSERQKSWVELEKSQQDMSNLQRRRSQLQQYRDEYEQQIAVLGRKGCSIGQMRSRLEFIQQLDAALVQVSQQISEAAKVRQTRLKALQLCQIAEKSVEKLIDRKVEIQQLKARSREQKEQDELSQKRK